MNPPQVAPPTASPPMESFQGLMGDLLADGKRLDVYDEPEDPELTRSQEREPSAARRRDLRAGPRASVPSAPFQLLGVFLGGMVTGGLFLALGFWAGHQVRPAVAHPSQVSSSVQTKLKPLSSTGSAETPDERPDTTIQATPGTAAKPDAALPAPVSERPSTKKVDRSFNVQVVSAATEQEAEGLAQLLKNMGYPVLPTTSAPSGTQGKRFLVQVGPYRTREEAQQAVARLQLEGFKPSGPSVASVPSVKE